VAKVKCKGSLFKATISMSLTSIVQLTDFDLTGIEAETVEARTLDGGVFIPKEHTGYANGGQFSANGYYDPVDSTHNFIHSLITTPADNACQILYADTGATTQSFTGAGFSTGITVEMADLLKVSFGCQVDGDPGLPT
jgi:hypothetical protein